MNPPPSSLADQFRQRLSQLKPDSDRQAVEIVDATLELARGCEASDVHLLPQEGGQKVEVLFRIDGVLQAVGGIERIGSNVVARLKVLAELLTYRTDVPQEGRIRGADDDVEMRVSTFPTLHGEKAVVRLFVGSGRYRRLVDLGFPDDVQTDLQRLLGATSGVLLVVGPSGSGKTTTLYACLREIQDNASAPRSICTLEDPIEAVVPGASQSAIRPASGFDYGAGLKSLMRQDPEVIMVGEIRDPLTAETVFQASLTGQLVLSSFHAGATAEAVSRLSDMGIEPYLLRSGLIGLLGQRLVRRLCRCAVETADRDHLLELPVALAHVPAGCDACGRTGYRGRFVLAELLQPNLRGRGRDILSRTDADEIERLAVESGMQTLFHRALAAVQQGLTSPSEIRRVFGPAASGS